MSDVLHIIYNIIQSMYSISIIIIIITCQCLNENIKPASFSFPPTDCPLRMWQEMWGIMRKLVGHLLPLTGE